MERHHDAVKIVSEDTFIPGGSFNPFFILLVVFRLLDDIKITPFRGVVQNPQISNRQIMNESEEISLYQHENL